MAEKEKKYFRTHEDLIVYQKAFDAAMKIVELSKCFPVEEKYSLTDPSGSQSLMGETPKTALSHQIRRSSCSVCANLAEAWRKRRYKAAFVAKLSDSEAALTLTLKGTAAPSGGNGGSNQTGLTSDTNSSITESPHPGADPSGRASQAQAHKAAETQVWLKFAVKCQYLTVEEGRELYGTYNQILSGLVKMITHPEDWLLN